MISRQPDRAGDPAGAARPTDRAGQAGFPGRRILLVRLRQIGDVVFTTPAITAVKHYLRPAHLAYLVEPAAAAVVEGHPAIDELIVAPRPRGVGVVLADLRLIRRLRAGRFDIVIDFHGGPRASTLAWMSGAPARIGYDVAGRAWMYTTRVARARTLRPRHSVENQWDLLAPLGVPPPDPSKFPVVMPVDRDAASRLGERLTAAGVLDTDEIVVIHVSAGNPFRRWPARSFAVLAAELAHDHPARRVVVTSGPSDAGAAWQVIAEARSLLDVDSRSRIVACGDFSLAELRALVDRAVLYVGGDSGPMHVAATSRVPMVSLYGPTLPARSAPWRPAAFAAEAVEVPGLSCRPCDQRRCEPGDFRCLGRIEPQEVVAAARRAIARRNV